jgi:predicted DCC family thiol-disulfide oxidoreductase YuxK
MSEPVIIYDGECPLCQHAVKFLQHNLVLPIGKFIPSSDPYLGAILNEYHLTGELTEKTVILIDNHQVFTKSTAIIKALQKKGRFWRLSGILLFIPVSLRDTVYDWIAHRRKQF